MPIVTGAHLGPYEIISPLGVGGRSEVYRARDEMVTEQGLRPCIHGLELQEAVS